MLFKNSLERCAKWLCCTMQAWCEFASTVVKKTVEYSPKKSVGSPSNLWFVVPLRKSIFLSSKKKQLSFHWWIISFIVFNDGFWDAGFNIHNFSNVWIGKNHSIPLKNNNSNNRINKWRTIIITSHKNYMYKHYNKAHHPMQQDMTMNIHSSLLCATWYPIEDK